MQPVRGPEPVGLPGNWSLIFDDEFNGTSLSPYWASTDNGRNGVDTPSSNAVVSGGLLNLSLTSSSVGAAVTTRPWNSPAPPNGGFTALPGDVTEMRAKFPTNSAGQCVGWGAVWMWGDAWPGNGEIDIAEDRYGSLWTSALDSSGSWRYTTQVPGSWCGAWHTYTVDREPGHTYVYWDGTLVESSATSDGGQPMAITLNLGYGLGNPGPDTYPATLQVDYVRVWRAQAAPPG